MRFTVAQVAQVVDGKIDGKDLQLDGVTQDSRTVTPGSLFVPLIAERDGHDYIDQAVQAGALSLIHISEPTRPY